MSLFGCLRGLALSLGVLVCDAGLSFAGSDCVFIGGSDSPTGRAARYRIVLPPPDYGDPETIRRHFAFSKVWGALIARELTRSTQGACSAIVLPLAFPDLYAELSSNARLTAAQCKEALQVVLRAKPLPEQVDIAHTSREIGDAMEGTSLKGPYLAADYLFRAALQNVYVGGSVMNVLMKVDAESFNSLDAADFSQWLRYRVTPATALVEFPACEKRSKTSDNHPVSSLPASSVVAPGDVRLILKQDVPPSLRRLLLLGVWTQKGLGGGAPPVPETPSVARYCNQREKFSSADGSVSEKQIRISCLHPAPFGEPWVVFFCEPADCASTLEADVALRAIQRDIAKREEERSSSLRPNRGPYFVEINSQSDRR